ncbi:hypothetical protein SCMU_16950 [Sinomonas cyclohexanicum]|uniref:Uncharacterized protein n=1 Tax=Sinomonas cyclohexanicum TaxID=322009 RepID=A0ABN6FGH1_SINCY|nr:hypothetical protein SCMU_16950 [Corynebacterium cyclohexanicum]
MWVTTLTFVTTEAFVTHANAPLTLKGVVVSLSWSSNTAGRCGERRSGSSVLRRLRSAGPTGIGPDWG